MQEFPKGGIIGKTVHLWRRVVLLRVPLYAANASYFIVMALFPGLVLRRKAVAEQRLNRLTPARYAARATDSFLRSLASRICFRRAEL